MARAKANVNKRGGISVRLSLNALIGIVLAVIGTFMAFYQSDITNVLTRIIAIFLICVGAVGIVNFFKYKDDNAVLIVGIVEVLLGILLLIGPITPYFKIIIGAALILYGAYSLFRHHKGAWDFITGCTFILVGILVIITYWYAHEIFLLIVGIFALIGAAYFLFIA